MYVAVSYFRMPRTPAALNSRLSSMPSAPANESPMWRTVVPRGRSIGGSSTSAVDSDASVAHTAADGGGSSAARSVGLDTGARAGDGDASGMSEIGETGACGVAWAVWGAPAG